MRDRIASLHVDCWTKMTAAKEMPTRQALKCKKLKTIGATKATIPMVLLKQSCCQTKECSSGFTLIDVSAELSVNTPAIILCHVALPTQSKNEL